MNLRQQIIANRVDELTSTLGIEVAESFMRLAFSLVTGKSVHAFDPSDVVDGGQDKQMDVFAIEEQGEPSSCQYSSVKVLRIEVTSWGQTPLCSNEYHQVPRGVKRRVRRMKRRRLSDQIQLSVSDVTGR